MISFINTLAEMETDLWRLVLVNNGVKLTIEGSPVLETLQSYEKQNISIWVCGTCLSHFDLLDDKQVGETTNMLDIVTAMQVATKVITP
jgi:selenium metabolism protein YedF